jgi:nucleoside-diphosphate-sugar epimerase
LGLKPLGFQAVNLGSDRPVAVRQVVEMLEGLLEKKARVDFRPSHPADVPLTWADITKARTLLGWSPLVPLEDGLRHSAAWYLEHRSWTKSISG